MNALKPFTSPDPITAALELTLAEQGDREAAKRLLRRVSMSEFTTPAVQAYLMQAADDILGELEQHKVGDAKLSAALRLNGKKTTGINGIILARAVLETAVDGVSDRSAIEIVRKKFGLEYADVKNNFYKYRDAAEGVMAADAWHATYKDKAPE